MAAGLKFLAEERWLHIRLVTDELAFSEMEISWQKTSFRACSMGRDCIQVVMKWCILCFERNGEWEKEKWRWGNLVWLCALAMRRRIDFLAFTRVGGSSMVGKLWYACSSCWVVRWRRRSYRLGLESWIKTSL